MGFKPTRDVHNLTYRQYPGLEICARGTTIGKLQQLTKLKMSVDETNKDQIHQVFSFFAKRIITWNVLHPEIEFDDEDEGSQEAYDRAHDELLTPVCPVCGLEEDQPLPTTVEAMYCLELKFILSLIFGWMAAIASVSDPKELSSNSGGMNTHTSAMETEIMSRLAELQNQ